jgi:hypothetical protein
MQHQLGSASRGILSLGLALTSRYCITSAPVGGVFINLDCGLFFQGRQNAKIVPQDILRSNHRAHTKWQSLISGVHSIHHDGKISPGCWGWGLHAHPLSLYLPSRTKLQWSECTFQLRGQIHSFISIPRNTYFISTLYVIWGSNRA